MITIPAVTKNLKLHPVLSFCACSSFPNTSARNPVCLLPFDPTMLAEEVIQNQEQV